MIQTFSKFNRVFALAGTLFLISGCAGRVKPWKLQDVYTVDVRILNTRQWSKAVNRDLKELDRIMKDELRYYLDNDFRIYEKLEPSHTLMQTSIFTMDSLTKELIKIVKRLKRSKSAGLDSVNPKTKMTYRKSIREKSVEIQKAQRKYSKSKEGLNKGFKKVKKQIIYLDEISIPLKKIIYNLRYKRDLLQPHLDYFNKILNESLFKHPGTDYSKKITMIAKKMEEYRIELDNYEEFLTNINIVARKEAGANVILKSRKHPPMDYEIRYEEGKDNYLAVLQEIRKLTESI